MKQKFNDMEKKYQFGKNLYTSGPELRQQLHGGLFGI